MLTERPKSRRPRVKRGTPAQFVKAFKPVALEMGFVARAWNSLHENLGMAFCAIISPSGISIPLAVWHSTQSDHAQREMLRAAVKAWIPELQLKQHKEELQWILNTCDSLRNKRNDVLHMPITVLMDCSNLEYRVAPADFFGHERAKRHKDKDLLDKFALYRAQADCLDKFSSRLWVSMMTAAASPERPSLPKTGVPHSRTRQSRQKLKPSSPHPPRSSPA